MPSKNIEAVVRCVLGEIYEISFYGKRKQKGLGKGWRRLVHEQNLVEGDKLRFEVVKCCSNELELKMHILRDDFPILEEEDDDDDDNHDDNDDELQEESDHDSIIIISSDDDDNDDDGNEDDDNDDDGDEDENNDDDGDKDNDNDDYDDD